MIVKSLNQYSINCNIEGLCQSCLINTTTLVFDDKGNQIATGNSTSTITLENMKKIVANLKAA